MFLETAPHEHPNGLVVLDYKDLHAISACRMGRYTRNSDP